MVGGCTDLLLGRRGDFEKCQYWVRDESDESLNEYTHNHKPSGIFYAKEITAEDLHKLVINGVFMFNESLITIYANGSLKLKNGDLIKFRDEIWIVQTCQPKRVQKNVQFMKRPSVKSYIQLKR